MVEGIQFKKLSIKRQVDSIFGDEDLMRLGDGELEGMIDQYFGSDRLKALDYALKRRSKLLNSSDRRKYHRLYEKKRKEHEYRLSFRLNFERDADLIEWLEGYDNKNAIIRQVLREYVDNKKGASN